jgi:ribosomal protein S18 acetylase RimI-like enzyme
MSPTTVVRLAETDWRAFATLRLRALRDTLGTDDLQYRTEVAFTAARWRRRLRTHAQFAAVVDERMVGLIGAQRETSDTVYLYSLWLEPSARRRGLARELVTSAVGWARSERARSVTLRVEAANVAALGVYEGLGFTLDGAATSGRPHEVTMRLNVS